ncbi:MAG: NAD(+) synthase [Kiritimatiellia bacterium]|jgi:NAD+ synthase (glutamine-hydrolysing)|nr:NAD(+) synthase [Kiritimatiellia bacterium]
MLKRFGYCRVCASSPKIAPGAVEANVARMEEEARLADAAGADVLVFPELCVTGYTCADLFFQDTLLDAAERGLARFLEATRTLAPVCLLGLPVRVSCGVCNAAAVCCAGRLLGVVPKTHLPNTREFYERRWFLPGAGLPDRSVRLCGEEVPFGTDLLFQHEGTRLLCVGAEICEDLWSPLPPSGALALNGATVICNLSASNELVGKAAYRRALVLQQSARCHAAYVYAGAGPGESTTDLVFGGHTLIAENGSLLAEGERFARDGARTLADADLAFLAFERRQNRAFDACAARVAPVRRVGFVAPERARPAAQRLLRPIAAHPFVPADAAERDARCAEVFAVQANGLATRLERAGLRRAVVGLSGGLDSALALLAVCEAFDCCGWDRSGILALTLPGFGTSRRTLDNALALGRALGVTVETISIAEACKRHLAEIGHTGEPVDTAYENAQARERTQILMDRANMLQALVVGTGDLSELALGWSTYNGDHMSMYGINAGVPKTLVRDLVRWVAEHRAGGPAAPVLSDILETPVSPELLPADAAGRITQKTEEVLGPYELHDFFLYQMVRCGAPPEKIRFLAAQAFEGRYGEEEIRRGLDLFLRRFFSQQFKRSCLPDGPKVGSLNLSPRGDWRMPSDASSESWLVRTR